MTQVLDLTARQHTSRVLMQHLAQRPGAMQRAGLVVQASASPVEWGGVSWDDWARGNVASATVTEKSARAVAAVTACVNLIAGSIASMPLHLYRRSPDGERQSYRDDLWWLLNERPHRAWSATAMWEFLVASRLFHGDAFARIERGGTGGAAAVGFEPLHPSRVEVERLPGGQLRYYVRPVEAGEPTLAVHRDDMLHIPGPGFDGVRSLSQLQYGLRASAGIALAADGQASAFFGDGARPDFALEVPGIMKPEQQQTLRDTFLARNSGQSSSRVPIVLAGGIKLHQLTMSGKDAELLETRGFQIEEICRVFGVPPFMVGHTEKTSSWGSGVEQMGIGFCKYTLSRHLRAIEQELNHKLFKTSRNFAEFVTAGLERGDIKGRYEAYRIALGRAGEPGWMSPNEIRKLENMASVESGDEINTGLPPAPQDIAPALAELQRDMRAEFNARPQPAPVINVAAPDIRIEPPRVDVRGGDTQVNLPERLVNVDVRTPDVTVGEVRVEVQPPQVTVQHPRTAEQLVERDPSTLEITRTVTRYDHHGERTL